MTARIGGSVNPKDHKYFGHPSKRAVLKKRGKWYTFPPTFQYCGYATGSTQSHSSYDQAIEHLRIKLGEAHDAHNKSK